MRIAPFLLHDCKMCSVKQAAGKQKVFRCSSFSKMLSRCGRAAHICETNYSAIRFPCCNCIFETVKFAILWFIRNKLQIRTRQRGNCSTLAGKSRGGTPFCRMRKTVFPKSHDFQPRAAVNLKFFGAAVFQKCWRGVGEQPTFAKQIVFATSFSCCNCIF